MIIKNNKIKLIFEGIIIPYIIYILGSVIIASIIRQLNISSNLIFIQGISNIILLLILIPMYIRYINNHSIKFVFYDFKFLIYIIILGFSLCFICNIIINYIPRTKENIVSENIYKLTEELNIYITLFIICIIVPLIEEIIFRGFFYDTVKLISNDILAILFTSISFALAHSDLQQIIYAFFAGIFISYIKFKFKNILYSIIVHLIMNLTSYIFMPLLFGTDSNINKLYILFIMFAIFIIVLIRLHLYNINNNLERRNI